MISLIVGILFITLFLAATNADAMSMFRHIYMNKVNDPNSVIDKSVPTWK